jgi:REP element-mobilizing transposase RayT
MRLRDYDYRQAGAYFVTLCALHRECLFGDVVNGEMQLNDIGAQVDDAWRWLGAQYPHVELDAWVIMPNHLHAIILLNDGQSDAALPGRGGSRTAPTTPPPTPAPTATLALCTDPPTQQSVALLGRGDGPPVDAVVGRGGSRTAPTAPAKPLGRLIGAFKTVSTKAVNGLRETPGAPLWQRDFYDHIVRDARDLDRIRAYIDGNPGRWADDADNPARPAAIIGAYLLEPGDDR